MASSRRPAAPARALRGLAVAAALLAGAAAAGPAAAPLPADGVWFHGPYRAHGGDDPRWASPDFDDGAWPILESRLGQGTALPGWSGVGWFRVWLDVPAGQARVPLYSRWVGAAEVFVDGVKQFSVGDPGAVLAGGSTPLDFHDDRPRWLAVGAPGRHLLAVRFASRHVLPLQRVGFPAGFEVAFNRPLGSRRAEVSSAVQNAGFIGAVLSLALLHLLLFVFHRKRPENLHYALAAVAVAGITATQLLFRWAESAVEVLLLNAAFSAAVMVSAVLLLRFYYSALARRLPRGYWPLFGAACALSLASWATPRWVTYGFTTLVLVEQARVLVGAVVRRVPRAWVIATGGAIWAVGGVLQMAGDTGVLPPVPNAYLYGFLGLLGSISVYLARDIADDRDDLARKLVEIEKLSEQERQAMERYRTIFETTGTGTITFGDDGVITLANEEWAQLTGYARGDIEGVMTWMAFFSDESLEKMRGYHAARSVDPASAPRSYEAKLRDRGGKLHDGVVTIALVPGTRQRVGSFLDLTELKRAQQQVFRADKLAALGQVAAGVAHEINNPNNFIHFNLPILRRYVEAMRPLLEQHLEREPGLKLLNMPYEAFIEDLFKLIENMEHGSQRITAIVGDLKHYVRSGEDLEMRPGSIDKVVEQVMSLVGKQVQKMVTRVDVEVTAGLPPVRMNEGKLGQVLINLLINAGQAADKPDAWVKLSVRPVESRSAVELLVEDNGAGISPGNLEQIFDPFFTSKGREGGTGLGLSISQQLVAEHGGTLDVTSEVGKGTCFTVRLPAVPPA